MRTDIDVRTPAGFRVTGIATGPRTPDTPLLACLPGGSCTARRQLHRPLLRRPRVLPPRCRRGERVHRDRARPARLRRQRSPPRRRADVRPQRRGPRRGHRRAVGRIRGRPPGSRHDLPLHRLGDHGPHRRAPARMAAARDRAARDQHPLSRPRRRRLALDAARRPGPVQPRAAPHVHVRTGRNLRPDAVDRAEISAAACPIEELLEIVGEWPRTAADLAGQVRVPVHYVLAEHEALWNAGQSRVHAFAGMFTSAPRMDATLAPGVGHNIDHHHLGRALQLQQLAFALTCTPVPVPA